MNEPVLDAIRSEMSKLRRGRGAGASEAIGGGFVGGREEGDEDREAVGELKEGVGVDEEGVGVDEEGAGVDEEGVGVDEDGASVDEEGGAIEDDGAADDAGGGGGGGGGGGAGRVPTKVILTDSVPFMVAWNDSSVVALVFPTIL
jgi:hypothetical protein